MSSDLRTLVEQEVELTHSELEDCFKQTHRILQTEYSRFAPGWVEYGHQVNKAVMSKVRAIIAAHEAKQATAAPAPAQGEPFGYFRAEPFGWTDCAKDDEGAIALYERPQEVGLTDEEIADMACAVAAICTGTSARTVAATAIEWTERALRAKGGK